MRLRLTALLLGILAFFAPRPGGAEDRVTVYGHYYRERSTRILQPMIIVTKDVPDERLNLGVAYGIDVVSSASVASGTTQVTGGDAVFTEARHEAMALAGSRFGANRIGSFFRYSSETDYVSRSVGANYTRELLQKTIALTASYALNFDRMFMLRPAGDKIPWCGGLVPSGECDRETAGNKNRLFVHYLQLGYSHVWARTLLGWATAELGLLRGPQDNPYRGAQIPNGFPESHPRQRDRLALSTGVAWHLPRARLTFEPMYRWYMDDWGLRANAAELRLHVRVTRHLRLRLRYRYYRQNQASFWRDDMIYTGDQGERRSADPKMDDFGSHTPGVQLTYELDGLAKYRGLGWLAHGWIQATYNHVIYDYDAPRATYCGNTGYLAAGIVDDHPSLCGARLGSLAFSLAF